MGSAWFPEAGRISRAYPETLQLLHPLHEGERVSGYPPVGFLRRCSPYLTTAEQRLPWDVNLPSRFGSREGRQVAGAVPLRCCSGEKTIPTEIPAFLLTFCSKKIHCDTFQSSKTGGDKSLGSSVRFGSNKNLTKDPLVLPSTKTRVIYHERDQKWMQSYSLLPSLLTCSPLEHQEESSQEHVKDPHGHSWGGNSLPALSREHKVEQHRTEESLLTRRWGAV